MIIVRLEHYLEHNSLTPNSQIGFRREKGTSEALAHIINNAQIAL